MRFLTVMFAFVAAVLVAGGRQAAAIVIEPVQKNLLPDDLATHLFRAERVTVFGIDPNDCVMGAAEGRGEKPAATVVAEPAATADAAAKVAARRLEDAGRFHGYKVVRSAVVDTPDQVVHLVRTLERAMAEDVSPAKSFIPEYGIRFTAGDKSEELLLSLECRQFAVKRPDKADLVYLVADRPGNGGCRATLEGLLDGAGAAPVGSAQGGTTGPSAAAEAVNHVGIGLYRGRGKSGSPQDNVVVSPLSLTTALSMLAAGAGGETAGEFARVLHADPRDAAYHARFGGLLDRLAPRAAAGREEGAKPDSPQLRVATRLVLADGVHVLDDFARTAREQYRSETGTLGVGNPQAASDAINAWVKEATAGTIKGIVDAETIRQCRTLLVNAVHLRAAWRFPFGGNTANSPFHVGPRETVEVPMMRQQEMFGYAHVKEPEFAFQMLEMPYASSGLRMAILLPAGNTSLDDVERRLSPKAWEDWLKMLSEENVNVSLPRFTIETPASDVIQSLHDLGVSAAFGDAADFSRLASERLKVDGVRHAATISVDETGTEAAATTSVAMPVIVSARQDTTKPVEFRADRPFLFVVHDATTRTMLFLGRLGRPDAARMGVSGRATPAVPGSGPGR